MALPTRGCDSGRPVSRGDRLKALSIRQPWAWLIAAGCKDIENRGWRTRFRGRIYVHAGRRFDHRSLASRPLRRPGLLDEQAMSVVSHLARSWRMSAIIGEVDIVDCVDHSDSPWFTGPHGFVLANPVLYETPIRCMGKRSFFQPQMEEAQA